MTKQKWRKSFGFNLKALLREYGMSQEELANKLGVDKSTVNRYVIGERIPDLYTALNIVYILDCDVNDLLFADEMITD